MAAGSIVIDLLLRTGSFESDTGRAEKRLRAFKKTAEDVGKGIATALVGGVSAAVAAFELLTGYAGDFQDLAEMTGAAAADLAGLAVAAGTAGVSMESVASATTKLTKNLVGVDDESKAAGAALKALGINVEDFKKLDPVAQYEAIAKALGEFEDGAQKTAVAMALFGKSGAEQLKVMKALEEQGGRTNILTAEQIALADEYKDRQAKNIAQFKLYAAAVATQFIEPTNALIAVAGDAVRALIGVGEETSALGVNQGVQAFAENAGRAFAEFADYVKQSYVELEALGNFVGAFGSVSAKLLKGDISGAKAEGAAFRALYNLDESGRKRIGEAGAEAGKTFRQAFDEKLALSKASAGFAKTAGSFSQSRPKLEFDGAEKADKPKNAKADTQSEADRYLESLTKQVEKTRELSNLELALAEIESKRLAGITPALAGEILARAEMLDLIKRTKEFRDGEVATTTKRAKAELDALDALNKSNDELAKEIDLLGLSAEQLAAVELQKVRVTRAEKESTLAKLEATGVAEQQLQVLQEEIDALAKREQLLDQKATKTIDVAAQDNAKKAGDTYRDTLGDSIEQGILDGFRNGKSLSDIFLDELKAQFAKTILRPVIQPAVDQGNKVIADLFSSAATYFSGNTGYGTNSTGTSLPTAGGAATGTNFVERDMLTILHKGEAVIPKAYNPANGGGSGGSLQVINNLGVQASAREETQTQADGTQMRRIVLDTVGADLRGGTGPVSAGYRARFGGGAGNLPRRN